MLDKLFVRVRSWLHNDPSGVLGETAGDSGDAKPMSKQARSKRQRQTLTPPPLPPDAWNEAESGMVITESGIIIIDPSAVEANRAAPPRPASMTVPADSAWALPSLSSPAPTSTAAATGSNRNDGAEPLNWDEVLARAKARISAVPDPFTPTPPKQTRAK
jgi:hypothetical protein